MTPLVGHVLVKTVDQTHDALRCIETAAAGVCGVLRSSETATKKLVQQRFAS